jgi:amidase
MNTFGPIARSARDALLLLETLAAGNSSERLGRELRGDDVGTAVHLAGSRILVSADLGGRAPIEAAVRDRFGTVIDAITRAGAIVLELPNMPDAGGAIFDWICADVSAHYGTLMRARGGVGARVQRLIELGARISATRLVEIETARDKLFAAYASACASTGAVAMLTPTLGFEALRHDEAGPPELADEPGDPWALLYEASMTGLPAVTIPMGAGRNGLPLGLQLMGRRGDDRRLLRLAASVEGLLASRGGR